MDINNIFCVRRNYVKHAHELGNDVPEVPMIFTKPTNAIAYTEDKPIEFPNDQGEIHYEVEIVLYIGKDIEYPVQVDDVVSNMAMGIDFTLRDIQSQLKDKGHPWLLAKGFKNAALLTEFWDFPGEKASGDSDFTLVQNDKTVQQGNIHSMIFDFKSLITYIDRHFGLKKGDIIFTGTPEGVGPIQNKDDFKLYWNKELKGRFTVQK